MYYTEQEAGSFTLLVEKFLADISEKKQGLDRVYFGVDNMPKIYFEYEERYYYRTMYLLMNNCMKLYELGMNNNNTLKAIEEIKKKGTRFYYYDEFSCMPRSREYISLYSNYTYKKLRDSKKYNFDNQYFYKILSNSEYYGKHFYRDDAHILCICFYYDTCVLETNPVKLSRFAANILHLDQEFFKIYTNLILALGKNNLLSRDLIYHIMEFLTCEYCVIRCRHLKK